jgi:transposase
VRLLAWGVRERTPPCPYVSGCSKTCNEGVDGVRVITVLKRVLGLCHRVVVTGYELIETGDGRPHLVVRVRVLARLRGRCGLCAKACSWYDQGGGERRWRHIDAAFATVELVASARRVNCADHGPTVAQVPWARHDSAFTRAFEDLVVYDAIASNKTAAANRHSVSWRAVNGMCVRVADEALGRVDLFDGLVAIAIDEVKYKKGQRYLTVVCDHVTGRVIWAGKGRSKATVGKFFDQLGDERAQQLEFVTCDGAEWIHGPVAARAPNALICLDTFHLIGWATKALDEVRRVEWNELRRTSSDTAAKALKGLRFVLLRNWENLSAKQKGVIRQLEAVNRRLLRAWQLKEELREIMAMPLFAARRALDDWLSFASRSKLAPFVKLARTIRKYRASIEATIEWKLTNGISESNNASIGRIRANARGFHDPEAFIKMIMLDRAGIAPQLPWLTTA